MVACTLNAAGTHKGRQFSKIGLGAERFPAIDLSCRACSAGARALGLLCPLVRPRFAPVLTPSLRFPETCRLNCARRIKRTSPSISNEQQTAHQAPDPPAHQRAHEIASEIAQQPTTCSTCNAHNATDDSWSLQRTSACARIAHITHARNARHRRTETVTHARADTHARIRAHARTDA